MSSSDESQTDPDETAPGEEGPIGDEPTADVVDEEPGISTLVPEEEPAETDDGAASPEGGNPWERTQDINPDRIESMFEQSAEFPSLLVIAGERAGETRRVEVTHTLLGRKREEVDIWFRDPSVSRIHAEIVRRDGGEVLARDLDSSNGTFVNFAQLP
ncbi:MAG: FHA domain-containing protein, partial [Bradymonadaceae bacterium]